MDCDLEKKFWRSGIDCIQGHVNPLRYNAGNCRECALDYKARSNKRKPTEAKYREKNKHRIKARLYGLTEAEYFKLIADQWNLCKICNKDMGQGKDRHIDHCHKTKKVRGLLCRDCNLGIGNFKHNSKFLKSAAIYCEEP